MDIPQHVLEARANAIRKSAVTAGILPENPTKTKKAPACLRGRGFPLFLEEFHCVSNVASLCRWGGSVKGIFRAAAKSKVPAATWDKEVCGHSFLAS
jgi:hypothetical protein